VSILHLERWSHDVVNKTTEIWCDADCWMRDGATDDIDQCTCPPCLEAASAFGAEARRRLSEIRGGQINAIQDAPREGQKP
jgi:hypothetical protein